MFKPIPKIQYNPLAPIVEANLRPLVLRNYLNQMKVSIKRLQSLKNVIEDRKENRFRKRLIQRLRRRIIREREILENSAIFQEFKASGLTVIEFIKQRFGEDTSDA